MGSNSNLPLAPVSCGAISEVTSQPHKKVRHQTVVHTARGDASGAPAAAATEASRASAIEALEVDVHATWSGSERQLTRFHSPKKS